MVGSILVITIPLTSLQTCREEPCYFDKNFADSVERVNLYQHCLGVVVFGRIKYV